MLKVVLREFRAIFIFKENIIFKVALMEFRAIFVFKDLQIMIKYSGREFCKTSYSANSAFSACHAEACLHGSV